MSAKVRKAAADAAMDALVRCRRCGHTRAEEVCAGANVGCRCGEWRTCEGCSAHAVGEEAGCGAHLRVRKSGQVAASVKILGRMFKNKGLRFLFHFIILDSDLGDFGEGFRGDS